ncbi:MAG: tyrosine--tRNA ligase, partial [bacterium]
MTPQEKLSILKTVGEEIVAEEELLKLLGEKEHPVAYDGFEPSGLAPIHFGLLRALNVKKLQKCGIHLILFLADFHAMINNKYGGDLAKIQKVGQYFVKVWEAAGVDTKKIEIIWASDLASKREYWELFLKVGMNLTLNRTLKSLTIMGRNQKDKLTTAQLFYPSMQVTDIFMLGIDICQLGLDQRRANMLAREVAQNLGYKKPVAMHHHMLLGLSGTKRGDDIEETLMASKMSKSNPDSAIFMHDTDAEVTKKIQGAFCPPKQVEGNPVLEYCRYILFEENESLTVTRLPKYGSNRTYKTYKNLESDYVGGN